MRASGKLTSAANKIRGYLADRITLLHLTASPPSNDPSIAAIEESHQVRLGNWLFCGAGVHNLLP